MKLRFEVLLLPVILFLAGCATGPFHDRHAEISRSSWAGPATQHATGDPGARGVAARWEHHMLPGKSPTRFSYLRKDGRDAVAVDAVSSASLLRHKVRIEPADLGNVRFSWKVPALIAEADMALREADDSPVRVMLAFEGDRRGLSAKNSVLFELSRALTGEEMPYATLMYVWCNKRQLGAVITSPRTDRIRKVVVESGSARLDRWLDYERNIRVDYERAFGEPPGALIAIAIMTDTDNTQSTTAAWYGPVRLTPSR